MCRSGELVLSMCEINDCVYLVLPALADLLANRFWEARFCSAGLHVLLWIAEAVH